MWKLFFDTCYLFSYLIIGRRNRRWFREVKLFDYRHKLNILRRTYPEFDWKHVYMRKGGCSLAFMVNNKYVFKVRKFNRDLRSVERYYYEKRVTDALAGVLPTRIPKMTLMELDGLLFSKSELIQGKMLIDLPLKKLIENREKLGCQLGRIIYKLFNSNILPELKPANCDPNDCGFIHCDMCSNIVANPDTMDITGIIDWEFAHYGSLKTDFIGIFRVRRKMRQTDIAVEAMWEYYRLRDAAQKTGTTTKKTSTKKKTAKKQNNA